jgi:hypothetical protein
MKKSIILSLLALAAVFAALWISSGDGGEQKRESAPPKAPAVTKAPEPPPVDQPPAVVEDAALKDALLGMNKPPVAEPEEPPARPVRRRARPVEPIEDEPQEELDTTLSDYEFQSTVGSWSGVKSCLATNSQRREERMTGAIQMAFTIQGDGNVVESKVVEVSNDDAASLAPCVEKQARHIRFPTFAGNEQVTKTAKFVF